MNRICGIDEAGRGPLAGPVTAAAVMLPPNFPISILADSKALSESAREHARIELYRMGAAIGIGWAWPEEIDRTNIHRATLLAMRRAFSDLATCERMRIDTLLVDGKFAPSLPLPASISIPDIKPVIGGDAIIPEIMAASIVAKVTRDRWMVRYSWIEPCYGYERHKGYPTAAHRRICLEIGASPIQRHTFTLRYKPQPK